MQAVALVAEEALRGGAADGWHFLRAKGPPWHLRLCLHGHPERLLREALPALEEVASREVKAGRLSRLSLETYVLDEETLGGPEAARLAERVFHADSEAALALVRLLGEETPDTRFWTCLLGVDRLLADMGLDGPARHAFADGRRVHLGRALPERLRRRLLQRLGQHARQVERWLVATPPAEAGRERIHEVLAERSQRLASPVAALRALEAQGRLAVPWTELATTLARLHLRRLLRNVHRLEELSLYEALARFHAPRPLVRSSP